MRNHHAAESMLIFTFSLLLRTETATNRLQVTRPSAIRPLVGRTSLRFAMKATLFVLALTTAYVSAQETACSQILANAPVSAARKKALSKMIILAGVAK